MKQLLAVILCSLLAVPAFGAFGSKTIWRVSTVSSADTNGGGFDPGVGSPGTDESTSAGVAITITTASTTTGTASPAFSATTNGPGNFVHIASGTGCTVGWHEIISQSAGTATFDVAIAAAGGDTCVGTIGGPFLTISAATARVVSGNNVCIKADGTYSVSGAITAAAAGALLAPTVLQGYTSTCGVNGASSDGGQATIQASATAFTMYGPTVHTNLSNLIFDCNSKTSCTAIGFSAADDVRIDNIVIKNFGGAGVNSINTSTHMTVLTNVRITGGISGCTAGIIAVGNLHLIDSIVDTNQCSGVTTSGTSNTPGFSCSNSISANNAGASSDGFSFAQTVADDLLIEHCGSYGNGRDGFRWTASAVISFSVVRNNWAYGNSGKSFDVTAGTMLGVGRFDYNAYVSGSTVGFTAGAHDVVLTADPTVAGASLNFALNSTAGGGTALKATGFPGVLQGGGSTGYLSIGPIQPAINGGSGGGGFFGSIK